MCRVRVLPSTVPYWVSARGLIAETAPTKNTSTTRGATSTVTDAIMDLALTARSWEYDRVFYKVMLSYNF